MASMADIRTNVNARVDVKHDVARTDILSADHTHDNIILALDRMTAPTDKDGLNHKLFLTAVHCDHDDDSDLGPHGHRPGNAPGWAIDVGTVDGIDVGDNHETRQLIRDLLACKKVTKVGTTGVVATREDLQGAAAQAGKPLFTDEGTGFHVHFQSSEDV